MGIVESLRESIDGYIFAFGLDYLGFSCLHLIFFMSWAHHDFIMTLYPGR